MLSGWLLVGIVLAQVPAPPAAATISWEAPRGCPDRAALQEAVERRLGRPLVFGELELAGQISRHVEAPRHRLTLRVSVAGRSQVRTLTAERCASLVDASALLVALALADAGRELDSAAEPDSAATGEAEVVSPVGETLAADAGAGDEVVEAAGPSVRASLDEVVIAGPVVEPVPVPEPRRRGPGGLVRALGGAEYGAVPGVTGAVGLAAGLLWRRARLEVQGVYVAPRTAVQGASTGRVAVLAAGVQGCYRAGRGALELPLCGGLELGGAPVQVQGPGSRSTTGWWLAATATAGLAWHVHPRVSVVVALQGLVHVVRARYELSGPGEAVVLFTPRWGSVRLLVGLELRFGDRW